MKQLLTAMCAMLGADVDFVTFENYGSLTVCDIRGLDAEYEGIPRKIVNRDGVNALLAWIKATAKTSDRYGFYRFEDGFEVSVGYASEDI